MPSPEHSAASRWSWRACLSRLWNSSLASPILIALSAGLACAAVAMILTDIVIVVGRIYRGSPDTAWIGAFVLVVVVILYGYAAVVPDVGRALLAIRRHAPGRELARENRTYLVLEACATGLRAYAFVLPLTAVIGYERLKHGAIGGIGNPRITWSGSALVQLGWLGVLFVIARSLGGRLAAWRASAKPSVVGAVGRGMAMLSVLCGIGGLVLLALGAGWIGDNPIGRGGLTVGVERLGNLALYMSAIAGVSWPRAMAGDAIVVGALIAVLSLNTSEGPNAVTRLMGRVREGAANGALLDRVLIVCAMVALVGYIEGGVTLPLYVAERVTFVLPDGAPGVVASALHPSAWSITWGEHDLLAMTVAVLLVAGVAVLWRVGRASWRLSLVWRVLVGAAIVATIVGSLGWSGFVVDEALRATIGSIFDGARFDLFVRFMRAIGGTAGTWVALAAGLLVMTVIGALVWAASDLLRALIGIGRKFGDVASRLASESGKTVPATFAPMQVNVLAGTAVAFLIVLVWAGLNVQGSAPLRTSGLWSGGALVLQKVGSAFQNRVVGAIAGADSGWDVLWHCTWQMVAILLAWSTVRLLGDMLEDVRAVYSGVTRGTQGRLGTAPGGWVVRAFFRVKVIAAFAVVAFVAIPQVAVLSNLPMGVARPMRVYVIAQAATLLFWVVWLATCGRRLVELASLIPVPARNVARLRFTGARIYSSLMIGSAGAAALCAIIIAGTIALIPRDVAARIAVFAAGAVVGVLLYIVLAAMPYMVRILLEIEQRLRGLDGAVPHDPSSQVGGIPMNP